MTALHLTFDDGPDPALTPWVLEALGDHYARATFFVLGERVRETPWLITEILARGHRVELHGDRHLDHRAASGADLAEDTVDALSVLTAMGVTPQWWRLPWGRPGPHTAAVAARVGVRIAGWDADSHDWRGDDWSAQTDGMRETAFRGGVVLLHDGFGPGSTRTDGHNTLQIVSGLLALAEEHGTAVRPLPDARAWDADEIPTGVAHVARPATVPTEPEAR